MPSTRSRSRSRSPYREARSAHRHRHRSTDHHSKRSPPSARLPLHARPLSKHDFSTYKPLFAVYLDVQKRMDIDELDDRKIKGRWKSFVSKWNHGDLAEGWYDPVTLRKAQDSAQQHTEREDDSARRNRNRRHHHRSARSNHNDNDSHNIPSRSPPRSPRPTDHPNNHNNDPSSDSDSDSDIGPAPLPNTSHALPSGPSIPTHTDLQLRNELALDDAAQQRSELQHLRKLDRATQRERLDELAPRAGAGSHERRVEKRAEGRATLAALREAKDVSGEAEVGDGELMGEGGGVDEYRRAKREADRKKTEREIRKEEVWRAKAAEREERLTAARAKEEKTMDFLKALAQERFG